MLPPDELEGSPEVMVEFRPDFAPHVLGQHGQRRFRPDGLPLPQSWRVKCEQCGQSWGGICTSGQPRQHVNAFAVRHLHRDPLAPPRRS